LSTQASVAVCKLSSRHVQPAPSRLNGNCVWVTFYGGYRSRTFCLGNSYSTLPPPVPPILLWEPLFLEPWVYGVSACIQPPREDGYAPQVGFDKGGGGEEDLRSSITSGMDGPRQPSSMIFLCAFPSPLVPPATCTASPSASPSSWAPGTTPCRGRAPDSRWRGGSAPPPLGCQKLTTLLTVRRYSHLVFFSNSGEGREGSPSVRPLVDLPPPPASGVVGVRDLGAPQLPSSSHPAWSGSL